MGARVAVHCRGAIVQLQLVPLLPFKRLLHQTGASPWESRSREWASAPRGS